jgi:hypothetical protein
MKPNFDTALAVGVFIFCLLIVAGVWNRHPQYCAGSSIRHCVTGTVTSQAEAR